MKIIEAIWFTPGHGGLFVPAPHIGIVLAENDFGRKAYIGLGDGFSEKADAERVLASGSRFHLRAAQILAAGLDGKESP